MSCKFFHYFKLVYQSNPKKSKCNSFFIYNKLKFVYKEVSLPFVYEFYLFYISTKHQRREFAGGASFDSSRKEDTEHLELKLAEQF